MSRSPVVVAVRLYAVLGAVGIGAMAFGQFLDVLIPASAQDAGIGLLVGLAVGCALVVAVRGATAVSRSVATLNEGIKEILGPLRGWEIAVLAVSSGLGEEIFFRGFLQSLTGIWVSSFLFALLHIGPDRRFTVWPFLAFGASLVFGLVFEWAGNVLPCVIAHATVNFINLRYLVGVKEDEAPIVSV